MFRNSSLFAFVFALITAVLPQVAAAQEEPSLEIAGDSHRLEREQALEMCTNCTLDMISHFVDEELTVHLDGVFVYGFGQELGFEIPTGVSAALYEFVNDDPVIVSVDDPDRVFPESFVKAIIFNGDLPTDLPGAPSIDELDVNYCDGCHIDMIFSGVLVGSASDPSDPTALSSPACGMYVVNADSVSQFEYNPGAWAVGRNNPTIIPFHCGHPWIFTAA